MHGNALTDMRRLMVSMREPLRLAIAIAACAALLTMLGIGCPIKFLTGISCPGCGMTRAWLSALHLHFAEAFAYHPLFWLVPAVVVTAARDRQNAAWVNASLVLALLAVMLLWLVRLHSPNDLALLPFSPLEGDVVSFSRPRWLPLIALGYA